MSPGGSAPRIHEVLKHIGEVVEGGRVIAEHFDAYDTARTAILPYLRVLTAEPLVIAADAGVREKLLAAVRAYERLTHGLREHYDDIFEAVGSDVEELLGLLLLTDIVVVKAKERIFGASKPGTPLFLWHYASVRRRRRGAARSPRRPRQGTRAMPRVACQTS